MAIHPAARCRSEPAIRMVKVTFRENPCIDMEEDVMEQQIMQPQTNAGAAQEQRHPIAIEAIDLVKDYGHGENAVHACAASMCGSSKGGSPRSWVRPAPASR